MTRRHILALSGALSGTGIFSRLLAATLPGKPKAEFDVDKLLGVNAAGRREVVRYTASATVMLFSIPLVSRAGVGSGYAVAEEAESAAGRMLSIQFGAGSYPETARGLNRLGFIQEAVVEEKPGHPAECAWLAFMTTSQEKNLDQAKKALEASGAMVPYSASQGRGRQGRFQCRVDRLEFASKYTWRDITTLVEQARDAMTGLSNDDPRAPESGEKPATFLYLVRQAILDPNPRTSGVLIFNSKEFQLETLKENDPQSAQHFIEKQLIPAGGSVTRISALLTEKRTGIRTPFRVWYEAGAGKSLPLRFDYQARSFLRLTFEAGAKAGAAPPIRFAFGNSKENA